jgi:hypothetical protein
MRAWNWVVAAALTVAPAAWVAGQEGTHAACARPDPQAVDAKAQSGAEAAGEASTYTAELQRCEGLSGKQRKACVELARKRLGQM